jgi:hypothetical protein
MNKFSLINVSERKGLIVSGVWMQDFTGSKEEAFKRAESTKKANGNRIDVAVVERVGGSTPNYNYLTNIRVVMREELSVDLFKSDDRFRYMMLGRLQSDCEYYLGFGGRNAEHALWAHDEKSQISIMKDLHNSFGENDKPQWLTWEQILGYERQMVRV